MLTLAQQKQELLEMVHQGGCEVKSYADLERTKRPRAFTADLYEKANVLEIMTEIIDRKHVFINKVTGHVIAFFDYTLAMGVFGKDNLQKSFI